MSPELIGLIGVVCFLVLLMFTHVPVAFAFLICGFFGILYFKGPDAVFNSIATIPFASLNNYTWTTIPLYTLMGYFAFYGGLAEEFFAGMRKWMGHFRGGLASSVIIGNAAFGACCGNGLPAAITFTAMAFPEMRKFKYADSFSMGTICVAQILTGLIPPSMPFIIYGIITQTSISKLFIAGVIPGILLTVLFMISAYMQCVRNPNLGPAGPKATWKERIGTAPGMWAFILIFVVIIGGLYLGIFTPSEAGGVAVFVVLLLVLLRRKLSWKGFKNSLVETGLVSGMVALMLASALIFNLFLVLSGAANLVSALLSPFSHSAIAFMSFYAVLFLFLGCFLDIMAVILLFLPILFPIAINAGVDPVQLGVLSTVVASTGSITPPVGIIVFAISGMNKEIPMYTIFRGIYPYLIPIVVMILLIIFIPEISTVLVNMSQ